MILLLLFAFLAGLITVLSPCILPVLPILLAAGTDHGRYRPWGIIAGLVVSFSFFTLALSALVHSVGISANALRYTAMTLIAFFGLTMLFPKLGDRFTAMLSGVGILGTSVQTQSQKVGTGFWSGFLLGSALGLIWSPCAGPILATIVTLVATSAVTVGTVLVTLAYSFGAALPMFLIMHGGERLTQSTTSLARYSEPLRKMFGALMILGVLGMALHLDVILQQWALNYFPRLNIENSGVVQKELEKLRPTMSQAGSLFTQGSKAPELVGIEGWINSSPLTLEQLRGKVVMIDFWTYSCINCVHTLPHVKKWYETYKDKGFVIIGVHTPEFEFEKNSNNVKNAVQRFGITYPVALDSNYKTWLAYNNHYWPAHYLIDQQGIIREHHFGEGAYIETENAIRNLLGLPPVFGPENEQNRALTPETYLGYERAQAYKEDISLKRGLAAEYSYTGALDVNEVGLKGLWLIDSQFIQAKKNGAELDINFSAEHVYLVMKSDTPQLVTVLLDGKFVSASYSTPDMNAKGQIKVHEPRMYSVLDLKGKPGRHMLTLQFPQDVCPYVFTFG